MIYLDPPNLDPRIVEKQENTLDVVIISQKENQKPKPKPKPNQKVILNKIVSNK